LFVSTPKKDKHITKHGCGGYAFLKVFFPKFEMVGLSTKKNSLGKAI
jgi:hypothetical protein